MKGLGNTLTKSKPNNYNKIERDANGKWINPFFLTREKMLDVLEMSN